MRGNLAFARFAVVCAIAGSFAACSPTTRPPPAPIVTRATLAAPKITPGELDLTRVLGDAPEKATRLGASPHSVLAAGETSDGERIGAFVDVPRETCLLSYARASRSIEDLDIAAFSDDGTPIVVDDSSDAHPTLLVCPPHPDRMYVSAHVANGDGLVVVGAHLVPLAKAAEIGRAFGAKGGAADGARSAEAWPGISEVVREHRDPLGGTWEEFRKVAVTVDPRAPTYVSLPVRADQCVDTVVIPDDEVGPLEVEALDGDGRIIARARDAGRIRT